MIWRLNMRIKRFVIALSLLSISISPLASCEPIKELTKQELFSIYSDKIKDLHIPYINTDKIKYDAFNSYSETVWYGAKEWNVACLHSDIRMEIDAISGAVTGLHSSYISEKISGLNAPVFEGGSRPVRDKESIIKEAEGYIRILHGRIPNDAFFEKVAYDNDSSGIDTKHFYEGKWQVDWGRKTCGYKYRFDGIRVTIHEKYGLASYGYSFFSSPPQSLIVKVTKKEAIEKSKPFAKKMARLFSYKLGEALSAELQIVNPNLFENSSRKLYSIGAKNYSKYSKSYTRLAWIVDFSWGYDKIFTKDYEPAHVWIDAETGEILGGGS